MGLVERFLDTRRSPGPADDFWYNLLATETASGATVSEEVSLRYGAFYSCVNLVSKTVASLPCFVYKRLRPRGKERAIDHPLFNILRSRANEEMTAFRFRQTLQAHLMTWGNVYAVKEVSNSGRVKALWPLPPDRMMVKRDPDSRKLQYYYRPKIGPLVTFERDEILHIPALGYDGIVGYSPVMLARETFGLGLAVQEFGARFFGHGANVGGIIEHPSKLSPDKAETFKKEANKAWAGLGKSHQLMVLEEGLKYHRVGIPPEDAQFLETRKFQKGEMAAICGVQPHKVGDLERSNFSNIEHQNIEFVVDTIRPWLTSWEEEHQLQLFPASDRLYFSEFLVEALLRGDSKTRGEFYRVMFNIGVYSPNDIREKENDNPVPGGDERFVAINMMPLSQVAKLSSNNRVALLQALASQDINGQRTPMMAQRIVSYDEERSERSAASRRRLAQSYLPAFEKAGRKIVRSEIREVKKAVNKFLVQRDVLDFQSWLIQFYNEHQGVIERSIVGILLAYAGDVHAAAAEEIDLAPDLAGMEDFVLGYAGVYTLRHVGSSRNQLRKLAQDALEAGENVSDAILTRLNEWDERRPEKIARNETVEAEGAFTIATYISG